MLSPGIWQKSSYSGGGQGDACVEVAHRHTHIAIRDSKAPSVGTISFPTGTFATFIELLETDALAITRKPA
jgi:hypothetical protein